MANFLAIVRLLAALFPILMETIKAVEAAMPESGHGAAKLALVKGTLAAAYDKMEDVKLTFDEVWPSIQMVITTIVSVLNSTGVFKK